MISLSLAVPVAAEGAEWLEARSGNLVLVTDAGEERARDVLRDFAIFKLALEKLAPIGRQPSPVPASVFAIDTRNWQAFANSPGTLGVYRAATDRNYMVFDRTPGKAQTREILFDTYMYHLQQASTRVALPLWWKVGVAEVFSTISEANGKVEVGRYPRFRGADLAGLRMLPLEEMLTIGSEQGGSRKAMTSPLDFHAQAWVMAHYFLFGRPERGRQMEVYLELTDAGVPVSIAVERAFGTSMDELEKEIRVYFKANRFPVFLMDYGPLPDGRAFTVAPLPEPVAYARLALAARAMGRDADASRRFVERAVKADPLEPIVLAAQAMQASVEGRGAETRAYAGTVLGNPSADAESRFAAAKSLVRQLLREVSPGSETMVDERYVMSKVAEIPAKHPFDAEQAARAKEARAVLADLASVPEYQLGSTLALVALDQLLGTPIESTLAIVQSVAKAYPTSTELAGYEASMLIALDRREEALVALSRAAENAQDSAQRKRYVARMRELE